MNDSDDASSRSSDNTGARPDEVDTVESKRREVVIDLAGQDELESDESSPPSIQLSDEAPDIKPRAYQIEMLEESLKRNIIVAADTGSGKTHIAVLRMLHELERIPPHQLIWFLAPTLPLCSQQFDYIKSQISAVQVKCLKGEDGVDHWTHKRHWDMVLKNVKIVVSTFQILLDALSFGLVLMDSLALIVFDEAHNCVGKHPGAKIMQSSYHKRKSKGLYVPQILALTASPVMRSGSLSLNMIEETLDAICRTPMKHRAELRLQVHLPVLSQVYFRSLPPEESLDGYTRPMKSLGEAFRNLKFEDDPYYHDLRRQNNEKSIRKLRKLELSHKTWSQDQMKSIHATSLEIYRGIGAYGADWYISRVITKFTEMVDGNDNYLGIWDMSSAEKTYLANALRHVDITPPADSSLAEMILSDKVSKLIGVLMQESSSIFSGIVFVQMRAEVAVIAHILSNHPGTRDRFKIGTFVGTSAHTYRARNVGELLDIDSQKNTLKLFKAGIINLVIATSVLEEGIDVPACNVVVCFQKPSNLKSFVQRRGRARHRESKLIILFDPVVDKAKEWQQLEMDMKRLYEDEMRVLQEVLVLEDNEDHDHREFRIESTNAFLDLDNAVARLYHFCATLPAKEYVDLRPEFICSKVGPSFVRARVILPLSVNEAVRTAESKSSWMSEKNAIKDAAFEAYVALYQAGLVNENLLPLLRHDTAADELLSSAVEKRASIMNIDEQMNPWMGVARAWNISKGIRTSIITLGDLQICIYLPVEIPLVAPFRLYWDSKTEILATVHSEALATNTNALSRAMEDTWSILEASFGLRFRIRQKQTVMVFSPDEEISLKYQMGYHPVSPALQLTKSSSYMGLIRDRTDKNVPYQYREWLGGKPAMEMVQKPYENYSDVPDTTPHLSLRVTPRRLDFLHRIPPGNEPSSHKQFSVVLPTSRCIIDDLPFRYFQFGRLIPSIMRRFEITLIADTLSKTLLKDVGITDLNLIVTAISASSANEDSNYQRLEFLGDSILKTCASVQIIAEYPLWHEGYLSAKKDRLVSNSRLSRAAIEIGLDKFIVTKAFAGHKWRPLYVDDLLVAPSNGRRDLSSKVLADVVEALIGAATVDGGIPKALVCLQVFLPELHWQGLESRRNFLFQRAPIMDLPATLLLLEGLIGYSFKKKALLIESITHPSSTTGFESLERFEFLGDSILDNIIVTAVYGHDVELSHFQMHLLRAAIVNADFLAFICMEWATEQEKSDLVEIRTAPANNKSAEVKEVKSTISLPLWRFMRHMSPKLGAVQVATAKRHADIRDEIKAAMEHGNHYPWALLARLQAQKFYSDIVESLLGAIWIDSGSFDICREVVERMGILPYLRRILQDNVQIWHPKEEIGVLADTETVKYVITARRIEGGGEGREYLCKVFVGELEVVEVGGGVDKEEVKTKAAERAIRILKARKEKGGMNGVNEMEFTCENGDREQNADVDTMEM